MKNLLRKAIRLLPPKTARSIGRLQFIHPKIGRAMRSFAASILNGECTIARGVGAGLKFDATDGFPGMILGTTEPKEQALLAQNLQVGSVFYDIGANIGFYSTLAGRLVGSSGRVYAFEPHPRTAQRCRENAQRNQFSHVEVVEAAVSARNGTTSLHIADGSTQNSISRSTASGIEVPVKVISIDKWRTESAARMPSLVMIDAEGQELEVLSGMISTLKSARPVLMIEVHWLGEAFSSYVKSEIEPLGYKFLTYDNLQLPSTFVRYHSIGRPLNVTQQ